MTSKVNMTHMFGLMLGKDAKYKDGMIPIDIVGKSSMYNGKELTYFSDALAANKLSADLNATSIL